MRKYFPIYEDAVSHIWLCNCSISEFPYIWGKFDFLFYQCRRGWWADLFRAGGGEAPVGVLPAPLPVWWDDQPLHQLRWVHQSAAPIRHSLVLPMHPPTLSVALILPMNFLFPKPSLSCTHLSFYLSLPSLCDKCFVSAVSKLMALWSQLSDSFLFYRVICDFEGMQGSMWPWRKLHMTSQAAINITVDEAPLACFFHFFNGYIL